jgi:DNA processing protein
MPENERLWWRIWSLAPGIGWQRLQCLLTTFDSLQDAWGASNHDLETTLARPTRMGQRRFEQLLHYRERVGSEPLCEPASAEQRRRWRGQGLLLSGDAAVPDSLAELDRPPVALYWRGRGSLWPCLRKRQAVAVVGTRRPSRHGEAMARAIGRALAEAGWPVVSGLAEGIDAAAHRGCLEAGGRPVAILGTPLERVYPRHHHDLQAQVARQGLLVSELPSGAPVRAGHFAERNRLQVALSCAVVLVECPSGSGALHSAQLAWQEETPLWVVPGDASRVSAAGSNRWLGQGATPLLEPADLIEQLGPGPLLRQPMRPAPPTGSAAAFRPRATAAEPLLQREAALLAALGSGACLDDLCRRLCLEPGRISERLLQLEVAGVVRSEPGLWWRPC